MNSSHKWPVTRKMFLFDDAIMLINQTVAYRREDGVSCTFIWPVRSVHKAQNIINSKNVTNTIKVLVTKIFINGIILAYRLGRLPCHGVATEMAGIFMVAIQAIMPVHIVGRATTQASWRASIELTWMDRYHKTATDHMMTSSNGNIFRVTGPFIHRSPVDSPHKGQWRGALMFSMICAWTAEQAIETPVVWDVITFIMMSL